MRTKLENPNAFPNDGRNDPEHDLYSGMKLRDYFAAKALQGIMSNPNGESDYLARDAYMVADAMLKERSKTEHP